MTSHELARKLLEMPDLPVSVPEPDPREWYGIKWAEEPTIEEATEDEGKSVYYSQRRIHIS